MTAITVGPPATYALTSATAILWFVAWLVVDAIALTLLTRGSVMVLGVLRGTALGLLRSFGAFGSAYGITWLVALAVTSGVAVLGGAVLDPAFDRLYRNDGAWRPTSEGCAPPELAVALRDLDRLGRVQLVGFAVIVACMVLMAIGL